MLRCLLWPFDGAEIILITPPAACLADHPARADRALPAMGWPWHIRSGSTVDCRYSCTAAACSESAKGAAYTPVRCTAHEKKAEYDTWYGAVKSPDNRDDAGITSAAVIFSTRTFFVFLLQLRTFRSSQKLAGQIRAPRCTPVSVPKRRHFPSPPSGWPSSLKF